MQIVPGGVIGYHPAALPRLRGRAAMPWTILNNEPITAGTLFWIDEGVDSGPILDQMFFHVAPEETVSSLYQRHMESLDCMMTRTLAALRQGVFRRETQDERCATWAARRTGLDGQIDWTAHSEHVARLVRAVGKPYPGAFTYAGDARLTVWNAEVFRGGEKHLAAPGQIVAVGTDGLVIKCGQGSALLVSEWTSDRGKMPGVHRILGSRA
jgi:methionyl-tRNA formyltransferase